MICVCSIVYRCDICMGRYFMLRAWEKACKVCMHEIRAGLDSAKF